MKKTVRVRVRKNSLELLEPIDLPEGTEVSVTLSELAWKPDLQAFRKAAGAWKGTVDAEALIREIYSARLTSTRPEPRVRA